MRAAIADGADQIVVRAGAGFDTLGVRMRGEHPDIRVVEIDQPATLAEKRTVIETKLGSSRPIMVEADFSDESMRPKCSADRSDRSRTQDDLPRRGPSHVPARTASEIATS